MHVSPNYHTTLVFVGTNMRERGSILQTVSFGIEQNKFSFCSLFFFSVERGLENLGILKNFSFMFCYLLFLFFSFWNQIYSRLIYLCENWVAFFIYNFTFYVIESIVVQMGLRVLLKEWKRSLGIEISFWDICIVSFKLRLSEILSLDFRISHM